LFNKVQIENKQLRTNASKMESKLEAKERLITHLETKVTTVMIEKEDIIVKLKSDIVLIRGSLNDHDRNFQIKLANESERFKKEF
jgi:hypothetical protein